MRVKYGDIWETFPQEIVVVPVNIGFKRDGRAVMGAGVAKIAAEKFPDLPLWWGSMCQQFRENTPVMLHPMHRLILFPTKPMNGDAPWLSWQEDADVKLIWRSAAQLAAFTFKENILIPLVGCGNGGLAEELVLPILLTFCDHYRFQLVARERDRLVVDGILGHQWTNWLLKDDPRPDADGKPPGSHFVQEPG